MTIARVLQPLDRSAPTAAILRHSKRVSIDRIENALSAPLNEEGRKNARALGQELAPWGWLRLRHSPLDRCRETAELVAAGAREAGAVAEVVGVMPVLGWSYMDDPWLSLEKVFAITTQIFVREWFDGHLPRDLIRDMLTCAQEQLEAFTTDLYDPGFQGLSLSVSHDWNVLLLREPFLGLRHEDCGWPLPLTGVAATRENSGLRLHTLEKSVVLENANAAG